LTLLLCRALQELLQIERNHRNLGKTKTNSLPCAITSQLQQSGLLQKFPSMLHAAAQLLQAAGPAVAGESASAAAAAAAGAEAAVHGTSAGAAQGGSSSSSGDDTAYTTYLLKLAEGMAIAIYIVGTFMPELDSATEAAVTDAAAGFCVAFMQYLTAALDRLEGGAQLAIQYRKPIIPVMNALMYILGEPQARTNYVQLLQLPTVEAALTVLVATFYAKTLLPDTTTSSSSSSSESDSTESTSAAAAAATAAAEAVAAAQHQGLFAWQAAAQYQLQLNPAQQQQQVDPCRQATGVSMLAAAWAAAEMPAAAGSVAPTALDAAIVLVGQRTGTDTDQLLGQQNLTAAEALTYTRTAEHNLLLLQLLMCSFEQQPGLLEGTLAKGCVLVAQAIDTTICALHECYEATAAAAAAADQGKTAIAGAAAAAAKTQTSQMLSSWVACMLPKLLGVLQYVQRQQMQSTCTAAETAASNSSSSSSWSSSTSVANTSSTQHTEGPAASVAWNLVMLLATVAGMAPLPGEPEALKQLDSSPGATLPLKVWSRHCNQVCTVMETSLRLQTDNSSSSSSRALVDPLCTAQLVYALSRGCLEQPNGQVQLAALLAGPGSEEQRHIVGVLMSMLKVCQVLWTAAEGDEPLEGSTQEYMHQAAGTGCWQAAASAAAMLGCRGGRSSDVLLELTSTTGGDESAGGSTLVIAATATAAAAAAAAARARETAAGTPPAAAASGETAAVTPAATATSVLPMLVLVGRCCLQWASLSHGCDRLPDTHSSTGGMAACDASSGPAAAAGQTQAAAASAAADTPIDSLPALALVGRCCLQWAGQLQVLQQQRPDLGEHLLLLKQASPQDASTVLEVDATHAAVAVFVGATSLAHVGLPDRRWSCRGLSCCWLPNTAACGGGGGVTGSVGSACCCTRCCSCSSSIWSGGAATAGCRAGLQHPGPP